MYEALIWQTTHNEFHHATVPQIFLCLVIVGSLIAALSSSNEGQNRQVNNMRMYASKPNNALLLQISTGD